jgi:hypothetical protein
MTLRWPSRLLIFGIYALAANLSIGMLLRHDHRSLVAAASCVDFLVTLPLVYYFFVIRAGVQPLVTMVPVLLAGLFRVSYVAPFNGVWRLGIAAICELGIGWFVIRRGRSGVAARVLRSELAVLRYGLASWGMRPDVPAGGEAFSMHRTGGVSAIFSLIAGVSVVEAGLAHLVVQRWSVTASWIVFGVSIYGAILLVAIARSFNLRPIVVTRDSILIRSGMLWSVMIGPGNIVAVERSSGGPGHLRVTGMAEPNVFVEFRESVIAEGLYGRRKTISRIAISADTPDELVQAIRELTNIDKSKQIVVERG